MILKQVLCTYVKVFGILLVCMLLSMFLTFPTLSVEAGVKKSKRCSKCHRVDSKVTITVKVEKQDTERIYYSVSGSSNNSEGQAWAVFDKKRIVVRGDGEGTFDLPKDGKTYRVFWVDKKSAYIDINSGGGGK